MKCIEKQVLFYIISYIFISFVNLIFLKTGIETEIFYYNFESINESAPFFSIVIPSYQRKQFISAAFKSCIEHQYLDKYNLTIEIICIDDASTDGALKEIYKRKKYYENLKNLRNHYQIKVISNEKHRGALYTRVVGLKSATGKYIFSLDSDDEFVPGLFQRLFLLLNKRSDIDLVQFRILISNLKESRNNVTFDKERKKKIYTYKLFSYIETFPGIQKNAIFDANINEVKFHIMNDMINKSVSIDNDPHVWHASKQEFRSLVNQKKVMWNLPSLLFKRNLIQKAILSNFLDKNVYNMDISIHEDYYICYVVFFFVKNFYFLDEVGYIYYRGTPRVKRKRNLRAIGESLLKFNYSDGIPKLKM